MGKKNIKPQQQQPIIRATTAKSVKVQGLTEENLTQDSANDVLAAIASGLAYKCGDCHCGMCSFDGDDAE
jgi:bacteriocin leader peptide (microcyclamide/patellamide family)